MALAVWVAVRGSCLDGNWRPTEEYDDAPPPWMIVTFIQSCCTTRTLKRGVNDISFKKEKQNKTVLHTAINLDFLVIFHLSEGPV